MTSARHVRRLRLEARDQSTLGRGRILVEDALRTASLPAADGGRLYVVRRLELGLVDPARPPGVVAAAIERRFERLRAGAVHAGVPGARGCAAVYFYDTVEPFQLLIGRSLRGPVADEWFWRLAVPGYFPGQARAQALRAALSGLLATSGGGARALIELVVTLGCGEVDALCAGLRREEGAALLAGWGLPAGGASDAGTRNAGGGATAVLSSGWRDLLRRWVGRWGADDARTRWLAAQAIAGWNRASAGDALVAGGARDERFRARVAAVIAAARIEIDPTLRSADEAGAVAAISGMGGRSGSAAGVAAGAADSETDRLRAARAARAASASAGAIDRGPGGEALNVHGARILDRESDRPDVDSDDDYDDATAAGAGRARAGKAPGVAGEVDGAPPDRAAQDGEAASTGPPPSDERSRAPAGGALEEDPASDASVAPAWRADWEGAALATAAGGLLFLIRPLARLGFVAWLQTDPLAAAEPELPARLLRHLALRIGVAADDPALAVLCLAEPPALAEPLRLALDLWCLRLARWLRRQARLSLRTLVRRPARVVATRTHIDLLFAARDADVRVRAAGLDVDPGWVPWFGRVVQFHYHQDRRA